MNRWTIFGLVMLVVLVAGVLLFIPEDLVKPRRIGILISGESRLDKVIGLQDGLRDLGYQEGRNINYTILSAEEDRSRLIHLARQLAAGHPEVIAAPGGLEADAALQVVAESVRKGDRPIPVVFVGVASTEARGLVRSFQNPAGTATGVDNYDAQLSGKRLQYFVRMFPQIKRIGLVYEPGIIPSEVGVNEALTAAKQLGIETIPVPICSIEHVSTLLDTLRTEKVDGLLLMPSFIIESALEEFRTVSIEGHLPVMGLRVRGADQFYTASFGTTAYQQGRQASRLVNKLLSGQNPGTIPVEVPDRLEVVVNPHLVKQAGLAMSPKQLRFADLVVGDEP